MLRCMLQVDYVFDFFNKILHTSIISKRNITFFGVLKGSNQTELLQFFEFLRDRRLESMYFRGIFCIQE